MELVSCLFSFFTFFLWSSNQNIFNLIVLLYLKATLIYVPDMNLFLLDIPSTL